MFAEVRLELGFDYGAQGGPLFNTQIITADSGREFRSRRWQDARGNWDIGSRNVAGDKLDYLLTFFRARGGRATAFRFKDWGDYQASASPLTPTGSPTAQLIKTYQDLAGSYARTIVKPVASTVVLTRSASVMSGVVTDGTTGIVTLPADVTQIPTAVVLGASTVLTVSDVAPWSVGDMAWVLPNGQPAQLALITAIDTTAKTLTLALDSSTFTWGAGQGSVQRFVQPAEVLTWSGEFDVPVRFDVDNFKAEFMTYGDTRAQCVYMLNSLPVIEVLEI